MGSFAYLVKWANLLAREKRSRGVEGRGLPAGGGVSPNSKKKNKLTYSQGRQQPHCFMKSIFVDKEAITPLYGIRSVFE